MNIYDFNVTAQNGEKVSLKKYEGKVLLIVNTATKCGFTKQYDALENMYEELKDEGFEILDFPCNQFFRQAPGTDEEINNLQDLRKLKLRATKQILFTNGLLLKMKSLNLNQ